MELGSTCPTTAGAGNRPSLLWIQLGALTTRTVAGYTPTAVGTGTLTTAGAVSPSTMAAGIEMSVLAGSGCPARSGVQLGLAGDITDSYVGWAPLPPAARFHWGVGFSWGGSRVGSSFAFGLAYTDYTFIGHRYFYDPLPWRHHVAYNSNQQIYENSTVNNNVIIGDNNTIINGGVEVNKIQLPAERKSPQWPFVMSIPALEVSR